MTEDEIAGRKIAWVSIVGDGLTDCWRPLDIGVALTLDVTGDFKMLGYGGWTVAHPAFDIYKENYPQIARVNEALPAQSLSIAEANMVDFLERYLADDEKVLIAHRTPQDILWQYLPEVLGYADEFFDMGSIANVMEFMGIPSLYDYDPTDPSYPERAVSRAIYHHAEVRVYGGNIQAWGNEQLQTLLDAAVQQIEQPAEL